MRSQIFWERICFIIFKALSLQSDFSGEGEITHTGVAQLVE